MGDWQDHKVEEHMCGKHQQGHVCKIQSATALTPAPQPHFPFSIFSTLSIYMLDSMCFPQLNYIIYNDYVTFFPIFLDCTYTFFYFPFPHSLPPFLFSLYPVFLSLILLQITYRIVEATTQSSHIHQEIQHVYFFLSRDFS